MRKLVFSFLFVLLLVGCGEKRVSPEVQARRESREVAKIEKVGVWYVNHIATYNHKIYENKGKEIGRESSLKKLLFLVVKIT